ncbi:MAG: carbamoyl-phosphate synthase large subunit, partial [Rhodospirillales bacterium]|nr:carbamoyl-phosphate synthase large subunit [Rhodospirillales bacterium]
YGLGFAKDFNDRTLDELMGMLAHPSSERQFIMYEALRKGATIEDLHELTYIKAWFIEQMKELVELEEEVLQYKGDGKKLPDELLERAKKDGFSDKYLSQRLGVAEADIRNQRIAMGVTEGWHPVPVSGVEDAAYYYSTYNAPDVTESSDNRKIMILGGGPNRIGQGIEFDYCCVHAAFALRDEGLETIMVNCNPETVSTDYDTSDRLYFEPLTSEDVLELIHVEQKAGTLLGVIVQFGGQTPLKLAATLSDAGIPLLGTSHDAIDLAEDRERFQKLIQDLGLRQPPNGIATTVEAAVKVADKVGYPVILRPSYVLGGRGMEIVHDRPGLERYMQQAIFASGDSPVLVDGYLQGAIEVDVDALADKDTVFVAGIMEHIEEAGVHSGDSACALPPHTLPDKIMNEIKRQTEALARALKVVGLMNVQFAVQGSDIFILEVNPRASRTVPFVAKATGKQIAKIAARVMAGEPLKSFGLKPTVLNHVAVKEAVFPFARFPGVDILLGPEMRSTGEVMGLDVRFEEAYAKSQLASGNDIPQSGTVFISVKNSDKKSMIPAARRLSDAGFRIIATGGTALLFTEQGIPVDVGKKVMEGRPNIVDAMKDGTVQLVFNTTEGVQAIKDSYELRRTALVHKIPYYTTVSGCLAATQAICTLGTASLEVAPLQSYS